MIKSFFKSSFYTFCWYTGILLLFTILFTAWSESVNSVQEKPNIIIVYGDDVGFGDIGSYGAENIENPNIDQLAEEGIQFNNVYSTSAMWYPQPDFIGSSDTDLRGDAVHELDWVVGQIINKLEELELHEETMIIFTSDNGPVFYDGYVDGSLKDHNGDPIVVANT